MGLGSNIRVVGANVEVRSNIEELGTIMVGGRV